MPPDILEMTSQLLGDLAATPTHLACSVHTHLPEPTGLVWYTNAATRCLHGSSQQGIEITKAHTNVTQGHYQLWEFRTQF